MTNARSWRWPATAAVAGTGLFLFRTTLARGLAALLPGRAQVPSSGTAFESFPEIASTLVGRVGILVIVAAAASVWGPAIADRLPAVLRSEVSARMAAVAVVVATALAYGWLGRPHHAFRSNARFHWVDYLTDDSDNFFYAAGRLPHLAFYDSPWIWNGILGAAIAALAWLVARQVGLRPWTATAVACLPLVSGNLLRFWDTAEDLKLNVVLLLAAMSGLLSRRRVLAGALLAVAALGRPTFLVLVPCVVIAEVIRVAREDGFAAAVRPSRHSFALGVSAVALAGTVGFQLLFTLLGDRHLLVDGQLLRATESLASAEPRPVDGFVISAFSGAYLGHLWALPVVFVAGTILAIVWSDRMPTPIASVVLVAGVFSVVHLLLHESQPLLYYNVRYLTYALPFLVVATWAVLAHVVDTRPRRVAAGVTALIVLAPLLVPASPIDEHDRMARRPEHELLAIRGELRTARDGRPVQYVDDRVAHRNYLAYVFRVGTSELVAVGDEADLRPGLVVVERDEGWATGTLIASTTTYAIFDVEPADVSG